MVECPYVCAASLAPAGCTFPVGVSSLCRARAERGNRSKKPVPGRLRFTLTFLSRAKTGARRAAAAGAFAIATAASPAAADAPVAVPVILPLTGSNAFTGSGQRTALLVLQGLVNRGGGINGRSLVFDIHD